MPKVAFIRWLDAAMVPGPVAVREVITDKGLITDSAGVLLSEDEDTVRIAQDTWQGSDEPLCRHASIIPRKYITEMQTWETDKET